MVFTNTVVIPHGSRKQRNVFTIALNTITPSLIQLCKVSYKHVSYLISKYNIISKSNNNNTSIYHKKKQIESSSSNNNNNDNDILLYIDEFDVLNEKERNKFLAVDAAVESITSMGSDFIFFGPTTGTSRVFTAVAAATSIMSILSYESGGILPPGAHPLNLLFPDAVKQLNKEGK